MKFRNPWIDPRIVQIRPEDAQAYLVDLGWQLVGPGVNPNLLLFDPPEDKELAPTFLVPVRADQGAGLQCLIDLVTELALWQDRYAGDVLADILRHAGGNGPNGAVGPPANTEGAQKKTVGVKSSPSGESLG